MVSNHTAAVEQNFVGIKHTIITRYMGGILKKVKQVDGHGGFGSIGQPHFTHTAGFLGYRCIHWTGGVKSGIKKVHQLGPC